MLKPDIRLELLVLPYSVGVFTGTPLGAEGEREQLTLSCSVDAALQWCSDAMILDRPREKGTDRTSSRNSWCLGRGTEGAGGERELFKFSLTTLCFWGFETNLRNIPLSTWLSGSVYRDTSGDRGREGTGLSIVYIIIGRTTRTTRVSSGTGASQTKGFRHLLVVFFPSI